MNRSWALWLLAFLVTAGSAIFQRMTGPTYPVRGATEVGGSPVVFKFDRAHRGAGDHLVRVNAPDPAVTGSLYWKRHPIDTEWNILPMARRGAVLEAALPHQPPAGKLDYLVLLSKGSVNRLATDGVATVIRFRGDVPAPVLAVHVIGIFSAMLVSTRAGLEALAGRPALKKYTLWTIGLLLVGGMILGPVVQKYAFGAFWTCWPLGHDLTDNKTAVAFLAWLAAWAALNRAANPRRWMAGAAAVTFLIFLIPHSLFGSELDYSKLPDAKQGGLLKGT
jgi:hypothetical protein